MSCCKPLQPCRPGIDTSEEVGRAVGPLWQSLLDSPLSSLLPPPLLHRRFPPPSQLHSSTLANRSHRAPTLDARGPAHPEAQRPGNLLSMPDPPPLPHADKPLTPPPALPFPSLAALQTLERSRSDLDLVDLDERSWEHVERLLRQSLGNMKVSETKWVVSRCYFVVRGSWWELPAGAKPG